MQNASETSAPRKKIICSLGAAGSGKTMLERTLPGKRFAYYFDPNAVATVIGCDIDYEEFLPDDIDLDVVSLKSGVRDNVSIAKGAERYTEWEKDFESRCSDGFFDPYDWIIFDSITTFQDLVMDRVLTVNGRVGKWPEQSDWTATINTVTKVFRVLGSLGKNIYCTGHLEIRQDETTKRMLNIPNFIGRLRNRLPILMSDIFYCYSEPDQQMNPHWFVQLVPDRMNQTVRTSFRGLPSVIETTIPLDKLDGHEISYGIGSMIQKDAEFRKRS